MCSDFKHLKGFNDSSLAWTQWPDTCNPGQALTRQHRSNRVEGAKNIFSTYIKVFCSLRGGGDVDGEMPGPTLNVSGGQSVYTVHCTLYSTAHCTVVQRGQADLEVGLAQYAAHSVVFHVLPTQILVESVLNYICLETSQSECTKSLLFGEHWPRQVSLQIPTAGLPQQIAKWSNVKYLIDYTETASAKMGGEVEEAGGTMLIN